MKVALFEQFINKTVFMDDVKKIDDITIALITRKNFNRCLQHDMNWKRRTINLDFFDKYSWKKN